MLEAMIKEKNAMALAAAMATLEAYLEKGPALGAEVAPLCASEMVRAGFKQAKAPVVKRARKVIVLCVREAGPGEALDAVYNGKQ